MGTSLLLASCLCLPAQGGGSAEAVLAPRLTPGLELMYRGHFSEESSGASKLHQRIEVKVFVLDSSPKSTQVAILTLLGMADAPKKSVEPVALRSVRLDNARLDKLARLDADARAGLAVPLKAAPVLECGMFVESLRGRAGVDMTWEIGDVDRPARHWKLIGSEDIGSMTCWRLEGVQQTPDWEKPRADHAAWRRTDTVWLIPRLGVAQRVERVIEHREPGRQIVSEKYVLRYDLISSLQYPGELSKDRQREIGLVRQVSDAFAAFQTHPARYARQLEALQAKIANHLENQPPTPYREAVLQIKSQVEAAQRGELPPELVQVRSEKPATVAELGHKAPDFVTADFATRQPVELKDYAGKPILLVFYSPNSRTADELLHFAQEAQVAHRDAMIVLGLAMAEDGERVLKQQADLRLTISLLHGAGLRHSYALDSTPKVVLLDAKGVVRGTYVGWGSETGAAILADVKNTIGARK